jgi:hypothetical protein
MFLVISRMTAVTEVRKALNDFIKTILVELIGPSPSSNGFECLQDGHRYTGIMLATGVTKSLMSNIGYYAHRVCGLFSREG